MFESNIVTGSFCEQIPIAVLAINVRIVCQWTIACDVNVVGATHFDELGLGQIRMDFYLITEKIECGKNYSLNLIHTARHVTAKLDNAFHLGNVKVGNSDRTDLQHC